MFATSARFKAMGGAVAVLAATVTLSASQANATTVSAPGIVTCTTASGGMLASPPFQQPQPFGHAGPVNTVTQFAVELGGCTAPGVVFTPLNGSMIDGLATAVVKSHWNSVHAAMAGSVDTSVHVRWYAKYGGVQIADTYVKVHGLQAYQGVNGSTAGNVAWFLGNTKTGDYHGQGPAGFHNFETANYLPIEANTYAWSPGHPELAIGGTATATVTPVASNTGSTIYVCIPDAALGRFGYHALIGPTYTWASTGLMGAVFGNLRDDPTDRGGYIVSVSNNNGACGGGDRIKLASPVTTSSSPSPFTLTVGMPLSVNVIPGGTDSTLDTLSPSTTPTGACFTTTPTNDVVLLGAQNPDDIAVSSGTDPTNTVCALKDPYAYSIPNSVGQQALWVNDTIADEIPSAFVHVTYAFVRDACTATNLGGSGGTSGSSCNYAYASGSFPAQPNDGTVVGDLVTGFTDPYKVATAAANGYNGYQGSDHIDPNGVSFTAIVGTDGISL